ncbi:MAG: hypothetical protein JWO02_233 [Solirubrobacterales bacterium]|nr:hypothetical protein [Solirubrobacterales bacterium]
MLIVEDDAAIASGLVRVLDAQGYDVRRIDRGAGAVAAAREHRAVLVLLDLGLPDVDGIEVCRRLRAELDGIGILIVSARDQELDVVAGLDAGADDYLVKPFRLSELLARVRAATRRAGPTIPAEAEVLTAGDLRVDLSARRVFRGDEEVHLRPKELELLALFVRESGRAVTRARIMRDVWDTEWMGSTKTLDTHVLALRSKIGPESITTLRGVGYRFDPT